MTRFFWDDWKFCITKIADKVDGELWGGYKEFITYHRDRINNVDGYFLKYHDLMKNSWMQEGTENLDRFKMVAAYTKAILDYPLFETNKEDVIKYLDNGYLIPDAIEHPNEYFLFMMIRTIMHDFSTQVKKHMWKKDNYHFYHPIYLHNLRRKEGGEFEQETSYYVPTFINYLLCFGADRIDSPYPLFAFSKILRMLEMSNDCAHFNLKEYYYNKDSQK